MNALLFILSRVDNEIVSKICYIWGNAVKAQTFCNRKFSFDNFKMHSNLTATYRNQLRDIFIIRRLSVNNSQRNGTKGNQVNGMLSKFANGIITWKRHIPRLTK